MFAYITFISTDKYLQGVLVLYSSLVKSNTQYPFYVVATKEVSEISKNIMEKRGIKLIEIDKKIELDDKVEQNNKKHGYGHWNNTLQKLSIFELTEFKKLVYLDSDMIVIKNIDELFEKKHMSAVVAGALREGREDWNNLNSGIMVINPEEGLSNKIYRTINQVQKRREYFGDQDLIQEYYNNWINRDELKLEQKYNIFFNDINHYIDKYNYNINFKNQNEKTIAVVHFVGSRKPWMISRLRRVKVLSSYIKCSEKWLFKICFKYFKLLRYEENYIKKYRC